MNKEKFLKTGLLEQYVLGLTEPEENRLVEEYMEAFPDLREHAQAMEEALENYARQYSVPSPPEVKDKILDQIEAANINSSTSISAKSASRWRSLFSYAALVLLTLGYLYQSYRLKQSREDVHSQAASIMECQNEKKELEKAQQIYALVADKNTQAINLKGTGLSPESNALVYWNESTQNAYFFASNLPEPPADKQYQIWADVEGKMIPIGLLEYQTQDLQQINYIANAESLNITLEPLGGSEHPNVEQLYVNAPLG